MSLPDFHNLSAEEITFSTVIRGKRVLFTTLVVQIRFVLGVMVIAGAPAAAYLFDLPIPVVPLVVVGAVILVYNILLMLGERFTFRRAKPAVAASLKTLIITNVVLDWLSLFVVVHLTGGITSPAVPVLLVHMLIVSIVLTTPTPYIFMAAGIGGLALLAVLEKNDVLPHYNTFHLISNGLHKDTIFILAQLLFFSLTVFLTVFLARPPVKQLRNRNWQVSQLLEVSRIVSSTLSLNDVLGRLCERAAVTLGKPGASIRMLNEDGNELRMIASQGLSQSYLEKGPVKLSLSPLDREALRGNPIIINDTHADSRIQYPRHVEEEGIASMVVVPILGMGKQLGVLRVYDRQRSSFDAEDAALLLAIARQGAIAIQNAVAHETLYDLEAERASYVQAVTHELRAPVAGAQSLLRTMMKGLAGEVTSMQADILSRLARRLDMLGSLIEDMLTLAASKTTAMQESLEPVLLEVVVRKVVEHFASEAEAQGVALSADIQSQDTSVLATYEGMTRILANLVGNAVKYAPGGQVIVTMRQHTFNVEITVRDNGIGIPAEDLPHIWEEFFRSSRVRRTDIPGTGLGLPIVKRLVTRYNGHVSVESGEGKGTRFTLVLPIHTTPS